VVKNNRHSGESRNPATFRPWTPASAGVTAGMLVLMLFSLFGCNDMDRQPKFQPLDPSSFFSDGRSARTPPADTVARGDLRDDELLYTGKHHGKDAEIFPFPVTADVLARGRERYDIFCAVCHGRVGDGQGMIVKRGFPAPPSYHTDRLRQPPVGHYFDVISNGYGRMYSYSDRIPVEDRWAIIAYIRALQLSQNASVADLPAEDRAELDKMK
jgi:mono/diheme cytochrome c family protein